jgi:hypothetical protein
MLQGEAKLPFFPLFHKLALNFGAMTSRRIMILAALSLAVSAYFIFIRDRDDFLFLFAISLIVLMLSYVFQFQLDQLMTRGAPQTIPDPMRSLLMNTSPYFSAMPVEQRRLMEDRMKRWIMKKEFINQNKQEAPEDVKYIMAYYAILLTLHQENYLYDGLDRIVFYHHPFLSPEHPEDVHIVEVEPEDGTIIISVPDLLKGHLEKGYYNLALHAMAIAFKEKYIQEPIEWPADIWERLEGISSIERTKLEDYLGMPVNDPWPVAVHHQLIYKEALIPEVLQYLPQFGLIEEKRFS